MQVNLLPREFQFQLLLRSRLRTWATLWAGCFVLSGALCLLGGWRLHHLHQRSLSVQQQSQPIARQQQQTHRLQTELAQLNSQIAATQNILPPDDTLAFLTVLSQSAANTGGEVQVLRLTMQSSAAGVPTAAASGRDAAGTRLQATLHGIAGDDQVVSQFISEFRSYGVFSAVELKSSSEFSHSGDEGRQFHLELRN